MRAADRLSVLLSLGLALAACGKAPQDAAANNAAAMDIEALPPDESVEAPANDTSEPSNSDSSQY